MELKPCPFCGKSDPVKVMSLAEAEPDVYGEVDFHFGVCCCLMRGGCGSSSGWQYENPEYAKEAWNRRVNDGKHQHSNSGESA